MRLRLFSTSLTLFGAVLWMGAVGASLPPAPCPPFGVQVVGVEVAFSQSEVVFLGEVVDVQKDQVGFDSIAKVIVKEVWKSVHELPPQVTIDGSGDMTHAATIFKTGQEYVLYVSYATHILYPRHRNGQEAPPQPSDSIVVLRADACVNRLVPITDAREDLEFLERVRMASWRACQTDADCVVVPGVCRGDLEGVDRTFQQEMEQWIAKKRPMVDCATDVIAKPGEPPVRCLQGLCEAQYELVPLEEAR